MAISGIHLLKQFMEVGVRPVDGQVEKTLYWLVVIHMVFVVSGVFLAGMDWISGLAKTGKNGKSAA